MANEIIKSHNFEEGLNDPKKRPNIHEWLKALLKAENNCLKLSIYNSLTSTEFPYHYLERNILEAKKELSLDNTRIYSLNCKTIEYFYIDGIECLAIYEYHCGDCPGDTYSSQYAEQTESGPVPGLQQAVVYETEGKEDQCPAGNLPIHLSFRRACRLLLRI